MNIVEKHLLCELFWLSVLREYAGCSGTYTLLACSVSNKFNLNYVIQCQDAMLAAIINCAKDD